MRTSCASTAIDDRRGPYQVRVAPSAEAAIARLTDKVRRTALRHLQALAFPYNASDVSKVDGGGFRKRIGNHRALFLIEDGNRVVLVTDFLRKNESTYR